MGFDFRKLFLSSETFSLSVVGSTDDLRMRLMSRVKTRPRPHFWLKRGDYDGTVSSDSLVVRRMGGRVYRHNISAAGAFEHTDGTVDVQVTVRVSMVKRIYAWMFYTIAWVYLQSLY